MATVSSCLNLGLPASWDRVKKWLHEGSLPSAPRPATVTPVERKFKEIPVMDDYDCELPEAFWANFPKNDLPNVPFEKFNIKKLECLVNNCKDKLLDSEYQRALKSIDYLRFGAPSFQMSPLPACVVKNSPVALKYGAAVTDVLASWVRKKFVAGLFKSPPFVEFQIEFNLGSSTNKQSESVSKRVAPNGKKL